MLPTFNLRLTPRHTLKVVLGLRTVAVPAQLLVTILAVHVFLVPLPIGQLLLGSGLLAVAGLATLWRLRRNWPVTELEVFLHLLVDIAVMTWLLYLAGGSSNPFVSAYLVPIALAVIALRPLYGLLITAVCIAAYTLMLWFYVPLPAAPHGAGDNFALHVFGMWVNFILSACLIAGLLWIMAENIRRRDRLIANAREEALRNEHVVALGSLAAGAAHELSTPLSTMSLVADELTTELKDNPRVHDDLAFLQDQIRQCKGTLSTLLASAGHRRVECSTPVTVDTFLEQTLDRWRLLRPDVSLQARLTQDETATLLPEEGLAQGLVNLLNNAADASLAANRSHVGLTACLNEDNLVIDIEDEGAGFAADNRELAGRLAFTTKTEGAGVGLLLTHTTLDRWGGTLDIQGRPNGGTLTRITLPLSRLNSNL